MAIDRKAFFNAYRPVYGHLTQPQVDGFDALFDDWDGRPALIDLRWLAYILATAFWETGRRMEPVREGFASSNKAAIAAVTRHYNQGSIRTNYALPAANGQSYYGRGLVQLTWPVNYQKAGSMIGLGMQLYDNPDLALRLDVSVEILVQGMVTGLFTGKKLSDFFTATQTDWVNARRIINGTDKASTIAEIAERFHQWLKESDHAGMDDKDADKVAIAIEAASKQPDIMPPTPDLKKATPANSHMPADTVPKNWFGRSALIRIIDFLDGVLKRGDARAKTVSDGEKQEINE